MPGTLYLVPNLLGVVDPARVLPQGTLEVARSLRHWVVETPKAARAFLKALALGVPLAQLQVRALEDAVGSTETLLAPALHGSDIGMLSDAGCPAIADPGSELVAAAHAAGVRVAPLVGPSSILLALMASGLNGQRFAFHGYLPIKPDARRAALQRLEHESLAQRQTQLFIETPYRNAALLAAAIGALRPTTILCVAADLTLPTERVVRRAITAWRDYDVGQFDKRPAMFVMLSPV